MAGKVRKKVREQLLSIPENNLYAVLDGASLGELLGQLDLHRPAHYCLYSGVLDPELAQVAPYLVWLDFESPFTDWLLSEWGKHPGIFLESPAGLRVLRTHLRGLTMVKNPQGEVVYFRYYDPRVFRQYLPSCTTEETEMVFGPILRFGLEGESEDQFLWFWKQDTQLNREQVMLT